MKKLLFLSSLFIVSVGHSQNIHHDFNVSCNALDLEVIALKSGESSKLSAIPNWKGEVNGLRKGDSFQLRFIFKQEGKDKYQIALISRAIDLQFNHDYYKDKDKNVLTVSQPNFRSGSEINFESWAGIQELTISRYKIEELSPNAIFLANRYNQTDWQLIYSNHGYYSSWDINVDEDLNRTSVIVSVSAVCKNMPNQYNIMIDDIAEYHNFEYSIDQ